MNGYLALLFGIACAGLGGEMFVRGAARLARWARVAPGIVGATVVAFATSSPELSVSLSAAAAGQSRIALGDALGSNVVNVALILGMALMISGLQGSRDHIRRDFPVALLVPVLTALLCLDGLLSRLDGLLLLGLFVAWLLATLLAARRQHQPQDEPENNERPTGRSILAYGIAGIALLVLAGHLIVTGASGIAREFGLDEFIIGVTIVAIGTSVPELATTLIAKWRGLDEISLGTVMGSNIFNGLFIVALAAVISPIIVPWHEVALTLLVGLVALMLCYPGRNGFIRRRRGLLLLALYALYLGLLLSPATG